MPSTFSISALLSGSSVYSRYRYSTLCFLSNATASRHVLQVFLQMSSNIATDTTTPCHTRAVAHLHLVTIVVDDYDPAIRFFVDVLGLELVEDSPSLTNDG